MSKKSIIALITVIVLLFAAGISVGMFLYTRGTTHATEDGQTTEQDQVSDGENQSIDETQTGENNDNTSTPEENNNTTPVENENNNNTATDNENTNNEVTTGTDVNEVGETTIERVEEQERLVSKAYWDWWKPMEVELTTSNVNVDGNEPQLSVKKMAITGVGGDKFVYAGQDITYYIAVTNKGESAVEDIEITDRIPENTTFVSMEDATIDNEVVGTKTTVSADNAVVGVKWVVTVPAGKTAIVKFIVNVNKTIIDENQKEVETTGTIANTAIANGEESTDPTNDPDEGNETKTAIIKSNKTSTITRDGKQVETAKIGDLITYTITVENTGDSEGTTYIMDEVPNGTEFISAQEGAVISENKDSILWSITLNAKEKITKEFTVKVKSVDGNITNIANVGGNTTNEDEIETGNIDIEKIVSQITTIGSNGETIVIKGEQLEKYKAKVGDVVEYTITVTNTGSLDLKDVVIDEQLLNKEIEIGELKAGDSKEIIATYEVKYENDIQNKPEQTIYNKVVVTGTTVPKDPEDDSEIVEDDDDTNTPVEDVSTLEIDKTATAIKSNGSENFDSIEDITKIMVRPGDVIEYTIKVTNTGNTTLENVKVTDSLKVTVNNEVKDLEQQEDGSMASVIAVIESLSAEKGKNVEEIKVYYTVEDADTENSNPIYNIAKATVPNGPSDSDDEKVPVNPDTSVSGNKDWIDNNNAYGTRPETITVNLLQNGKKIDSVKVSPDIEGNWKYEFVKLPKYDITGNLYVYTVEEEKVAGYTSTQSGNNFTNTIEQDNTVEVSGTKTWIDPEGTEHPTITINLLRDGEKVDSKELANGTTSYTFNNLPKYDLTDGHIYVYTVTENPVEGYTSVQDGNNFTNTINQTTTSVTVKKVWDAPNITEHPDIKINLYQNDNKTTPYATTTLSAGEDKVWQKSELTYTWNELPKYLVDTNGDYILDDNGNVQLNKYTAQEEELTTYRTSYSDDTFEITNTAKGILQVTSISTTQTENKVPADVVFVLDISGSMCEENSSSKRTSRAKDMVDAVNSAINTVMTNNPNSRIAVVTYSTDSTYVKHEWISKNNATTILELGTYTPKSGSKEYLTCSQGKREWNDDDEVYKYENVSISTNVREKATKTVNVTGGTYTQSGIAMGANILANANTQYDPDGKNGPIEPVTRTPIFILLSDGEPTFYTTQYANVGELEGGHSSYATEDEAYYTIRTAVEYKKDIIANYGTANMYTIGFGADSLLLKTTLNPNKENIDSCKNTNRDSYTKKLYNKLNSTTEGAYGFSYADASYTTGSMSAEDLANLINKYISISQPHNSYRIFTEEELTNQRVNLVNIDVEATTDIENFISYGNTKYSFEEAKNRGIVKVDNKTYYVDLSMIQTANQIYLKYQTIPEKT